MRQLVIAIVAVATIARADPAKPAAPKPPDTSHHASEPAKPIDIKPLLGKLDVFRDEAGMYYVSPQHDAFENWGDAGGWVFAGDGKKMYQQRVVGSSYDPSRGAEWLVWSPRSKRSRGAAIALGQLYVECQGGKNGRRTLTALKADEAKVLLARATFYPPLWERQAHRLARDDDGIYYYIDILRDEVGGNGFRLFVGPSGAMKQLTMTNIAHDSGGEIFATKSGQLKMVFTDRTREIDEVRKERVVEGTWIKGSTRVPLTVLDPVENLYLIYREFGIYGALGTPCDDF
jgi:hypothetical protein